jgi:hypothetical protein
MPPPVIRYVILNGVRRAKVFHEYGIPFIRAMIDGQPGVVDVRVDELGSPHKPVLDVTSPTGRIRYNSIVQAVRAGRAGSLPPIEVCVGTHPPHIADVRKV